LATVSHELRTPLTALAGYEELLADQVVGPLAEGQIDILERMRSVTQHLASVIEEVLTFSSLDEGRETIRPTDFLAADLVRATAAVIEPLARQKHLAFRYSVPDAAIRMTSDVDKIRQILINLAGNAVKFTDAGEVRLEVEQRDAEVCFTVHDTGIGIARDDLERLFKPFAQLDTRLTRRHGGTGLGLYIARRLAELLNGRIEVESEPGKGSTFSLILPGDDA
jgi:signal transduction histidine kinase